MLALDFPILSEDNDLPTLFNDKPKAHYFRDSYYFKMLFLFGCVALLCLQDIRFQTSRTQLIFRKWSN